MNRDIYTPPGGPPQPGPSRDIDAPMSEENILVSIQTYKPSFRNAGLLFLSMAFFILAAPPRSLAGQGLGKFLFSGQGKNDWEIFAVNGDGTGQKQLTDTGGKAFDPKWSPDGSLFAYRLGDWGDQAGFGLCKASGDKLAGVQWEGSKFFSFAWSPDGKRIYYSSNRNDSDFYIHEMDIETGEDRCLLEKKAGCMESLACSPDGKMVAYVESNDDSATDQTVILDSGTGKEIVRSRLTAKAEELPSNGGDGYLSADILELHWTSDSAQVYFTRLGSVYQVYFMEVPSGKTRKWATEGDEEFVWDPEDALAVFGTSAMPGVYRSDLSGGDRERLTKEGWWSGNPQIVCSGKKIAYESNCDMDINHLGNCSLYLMDSDGQSPRRLTPLILDAYKSSYSWHP